MISSILISNINNELVNHIHIYIYFFFVTPALNIAIIYLSTDHISYVGSHNTS